MKIKTLAALLLITNILVRLSAQTQILRLTYATGWGQGGTNLAFTDFENWTARFAANFDSLDAGAKARLVTEGAALAKLRRRAFAELIKTDPETAIKLTVPAAIRQRLPTVIAADLETRVSGIGDYSVLAALPAKDGPGIEPIQRFVLLNDDSYRACVYGKRLGETCKNGIPLHGVALDGVLALHEGALRGLEPGESPESTRRVIEFRAATHQSAAGAAATVAELGGALYRFSSPEEAEQAEARLEAAEVAIGPAPGSSAFSIMQDDGGAGSGTQKPLNAGTPWTTGVQRVLIIRVDFSDLPGDPVSRSPGTTYTASYVKGLADGAVGSYYLNSSYGLTSLSNTVTTQVFRMPRTAAYYSTNTAYGQLHFDAETAASAAYSPGNYDRLIVLSSYLSYSSFSFMGLAMVGGGSVWLNGIFDFYDVAHELGHTYGLNHANLWQVSDGNPASATGSTVEYGDYYDVMGSYYEGTPVDFNPFDKNLLGWIADAQVQGVTANGIYRIYAFDTENHASAPGEVLALKIFKSSTRNYWIGYRRNFHDNPSLAHGAYIIWGPTYAGRTDLLDMTTPGTNIQDAGLGIGSIFNDSAAQLTIRPVGEGGVGSNLYLDVQVSFGAVPPLAPMFTSPASNTVAVLGSNGVFSVVAAGNPAPTCHWQRLPSGGTNWEDLSDDVIFGGSQTATLKITPPSVAMTGDQFRCVTANSSGSVTSSPPAWFTVAPPLVVATLAGTVGVMKATDGVGTNASFVYPSGLATDAAGNIYVAERYTGHIRKLNSAGTVGTLASNCFSPTAVALDMAGNLYLADASYDMIRKVTPAGVVSAIAGLSAYAGSADGPGLQAQFNTPRGIAVDRATNVFVADTFNNKIRMITTNATDGGWLVRTIAGTLSSGNVDGVGSAARFSAPEGIAVGEGGRIYVADTGNCSIRELRPADSGTNWVVTTITGSYLGNIMDGVGTNSHFNNPVSLAVDKTGNIYVADGNGQVIRKMALDVNSTNWAVTTVAGTGFASGSADGTGGDVRFNHPSGIAVDGATNIYITDFYNGTIRAGRFASVIVPALQVTRPVDQMILSWPIPTATFALESTTNLMMTNWAPVAQPPAVLNGQYVVTNNLPGKTMFFRAKRQ